MKSDIARFKDFPHFFHIHQKRSGNALRRLSMVTGKRKDLSLQFGPLTVGIDNLSE